VIEFKTASAIMRDLQRIFLEGLHFQGFGCLPGCRTVAYSPVGNLEDKVIDVGAEARFKVALSAKEERWTTRRWRPFG
jgi:hypothetical protein